MSLASRLAKLAVRAVQGAGERKAPLAVKRAAPLALPAPPKVLALPAPKPKPKGKPRGGQFFPDAPLAARDAQAAGYKVRDRGEHGHPKTRYQVVRPDGEGLSGYHAPTPQGAFKLADAHYDRDRASFNPSPEAAARETVENSTWLDEPTSDWLRKSLAKYYKTDFGTEADPLSDLAARGLHYDPDMTPERWLDTVNSSLMEDPIGYYTVPRHASEIAAENAPVREGMMGDLDALDQQLAPGLSYYGNADPIGQGALMQAAPWLRKQPVTDMLYGIREPLGLGHFADEMRNAMNAAESGLPPDLAVRPEMLERMSFPQAVERVGRINQFRVKQMEAERAAQMNNPAIHPFKEYPEGMRWVELRAPDPADRFKLQPVEENGASFWRATDPETGETWPLGGTREQAIDSLRYHVREPLQQALKAEGDTMGHCVGGYCDDVVSGRSRIFSLRDAKGMPHVTVETKPGTTPAGKLRLDELEARDPALRDKYLAYAAAPMSETSNIGGGFAGWLERNHPDVHAQYPDLFTRVQDIVQIKGKQNRAPNPEYLPFVQDFVKSGQWGDIGDLGNTGLERLPDRRFITQQQLEEGINKFYAQGGKKSPYYNQPENWVPEDWEQLKPHFEGYARGGLAVKKCGCMQCGGLAVKRAA